MTETDAVGEAERSEADEFDGDRAESAADEMAAIRARAESIRDEEVARALSKLAAQDELTPERREEVERLADRIVEQLLAVPAETLAAADEERAEVAETARELFGD
ncbi:hypothetical protein [Halomicrobium salinisoli]|uniref:hypothetical protein n=1 Tax=Halomicrobium salinisoli TaxID=2878391 RepID=UPI001CF01A96|nr:hypothetical protein [Halomicrobium salinisoli]